MNFSDLGNELVDGSGKTVSRSQALANKAGIALYFSAHWCPPCRQFTPVLAELYRKSYKAKGMEIVFVSSDKDEGAFREYMRDMPWLAIPFSDRNAKQRLSQTFGINGIPALLIFDGQGNLVNANGREAAMQDTSGDRFFGLKAVSNLFTGQGATLGGSSNQQSHMASVPQVTIDPTQPQTKIQFRFPDGNKIAQSFNETATLMHLTAFASGALGGAKVTLSAGFPLRELEEMAQSLKDADLFNAVVNVKQI
jgi:thiol-disulfide isomerase/thioredoxin